MSNKKLWSTKQNLYFISDVSNTAETLPLGIYNLCYDPKKGAYLERLADDFKFDYKIYGAEQSFIKRVQKTYLKTTGNLGVLMNGVKGTGKTVTAKLIANTLGQPIILAHINIGQAMIDFINSINQNITVFFDEFEKIFIKNPDTGEDGQVFLLALMDGMYTSKYRRVFLLTTNQTSMDSNFLERPGRIRYVKQFEDLSLEVIEELVDDLLEPKHLKEECIEYIAKLNIITIDIVKSIINEVNIHEESPFSFNGIFNVRFSEPVYKLYKSKEGEEETLLYYDLDVNRIQPRPDTWPKNNPQGNNFIIHGSYWGTIKELVADDTIKVCKWTEDSEGRDIEKIYTYRLEKVDKKHRAYLKNLAL